MTTLKAVLKKPRSTLTAGSGVRPVRVLVPLATPTGTGGTVAAGAPASEEGAV